MRPALLFAVVACAGACHPQDMDPLEQQAKYKPYSENEFFADDRAMRTPPAGTIARERVLVPTPEPLTAELVAIGRTRYDSICAVCHGLVGNGDSIVAGKMGLRPPPSLLAEDKRALPAESMYHTISDGYGLMPRYETMLTPRERWAVIAYVRALQLSQRVPLAEVPIDIRQKLETP